MLNPLALRVAGFMLAITGCGGAAAGDGTEPGSATQRLGDKQHCVGQSFAQPRGLAAPERAPEPQLTCFDSFSEVIGHLSQGTVRLAVDATPEDLTEEHVNQMASLATYVIGIEYEHGNWGGATYTIWSGVTCSGHNHWVGGMPGGWNDIVSAARSFSGCNNS
ncbi:hypothetical protein LXT21_44435 [Myxococcus sp. K38C18041901]|uniref:hypothetical protein n=1 Tax=Myxococcus guangdongensis TaxID=2906760 RepID=UPI0020A818EC|nr:hypothetical protein [Myxococcus guangdongensis]MCP3065839.1 hypothetical protein [Myxococcus guangdongensis]